MDPRAPAPGASAAVAAASPARAKAKFTADEDARLLALVDARGARCWGEIAGALGGRNARQCRERFANYLDPRLRRGEWAPEEDRLLERKVAELGARWNKIAKCFAGRSDNALRNRWMVLARQRTRERRLPPAAWRSPAVPIVLPVLGGPAAAHTRAAGAPIEILDELRTGDALERHWDCLWEMG
jgi:hypothetical protein